MKSNTFGLEIWFLILFFTKKNSYFRYWYTFTTPAYGNCFTFNSDYNKKDLNIKRNTSLTGSSNGLIVEVFLDQANYMLNKLSKKAGARLIIHNPNSPPLADEYGIDLQPNTASSVSIQQVINSPKAFREF